MSKLKRISLVLAFVVAAFTVAQAADFSIGIGTGNYYVSVGDYDYLPYAYQTNPGFVPPRVNFYNMMSDYGTWVTVSPFGQVWQPYASHGWRPYTYGHWTYTSQYGPMWQGYEPWAWAGYHYGNWIFAQQYGWVWIPGYQWHPGQVAWSNSYDSIGWMPLPPAGYDYSRGYLSYIGPQNQFGCNDSDFGVSFSMGGIGLSYGGPYYNPTCRNLYYNSAYLGQVPNLWTFIGSSNFGNDNYADYYLGPDYARYVFDRRLLRITARPIDRTVLQRITGVTIEETPVAVKQLQTDKQTVRVVVPTSDREIERVRKYSNQVVEEVIAPAFAEKRKAFKGQASKNKEVVAKIFRQENAQPRVKELSTQEVVSRAQQAKQQRDERRAQRAAMAKEKVAPLADN